MKQKKFVFIALGIVVIVLVILVGLFIFGTGSKDVPTDTGPVFGDTSPDRPFDGYVSDTQQTGTSTQVLPTGGTLPELRQLTNRPVAGAVLVQRTVGDLIEPYVRYTERENGHVSDVSLLRSEAPVVVSVTTIPRVQEALWSATGSTTVYVYLDAEGGEVYRYLATLRPHTPTEGEEASQSSELYGEFLPSDITSLSFSPSGNSLFYVAGSGSSAAGFVRSVATGDARKVWESPLHDLEVTWNADDTAVLYTKPSAESAGFAWLVDTKTGASSLTLTDRLGLTAVSDPAGEHVLFSSMDGPLTSLQILDVQTRSIQYLPLVTLPEKCVWSKLASTVVYCAVPATKPQSSEFPDTWYRGTHHFSDALWKIDTATNETTMLAEPEKLIQRSMDAVDLMLDPSEQYLLFKTKNDDLLWSFHIPTVVQKQDESVSAAATETTL